MINTFKKIDSVIEKVINNKFLYTIVQKESCIELLHNSHKYVN